MDIHCSGCKKKLAEAPDHECPAGPIVRPFNRVRVVYEGEPVSARVELVVYNEDGTETVHDIPCEQVSFYAQPDAARLVLKLNGRFVTTHFEGQIDYLAEQLLERAARHQDGPAQGWPMTIKEAREAPTLPSPDDVQTQPGIKRRK